MEAEMMAAAGTAQQDGANSFSIPVPLPEPPSAPTSEGSEALSIRSASNASGLPPALVEGSMEAEIMAAAGTAQQDGANSFSIPVPLPEPPSAPTSEGSEALFIRSASNASGLLPALVEGSMEAEMMAAAGTAQQDGANSFSIPVPLP